MDYGTFFISMIHVPVQSKIFTTKIQSKNMEIIHSLKAEVNSLLCPLQDIYTLNKYDSQITIIRYIVYFHLRIYDLGNKH